MPGLYSDLNFRGLVYQTSSEELANEMDADGSLCLYAGFDPTAGSLHVGHLLQLCMLKRFAQKGHRVFALLGGATGLIGDPSGKTAERPMLDTSVVDRNVILLSNQVHQILGQDSELLTIVNNLDWWSKMNVTDFLRNVGKYVTVNQMMAKESVKKRLENPETGISYAEFSYMLLQAYDFLYLFENYGVNLQLGASDQWGNIVQGIDLIRRVKKYENARGLTTPLVTKSDGQKFGKTESGTVWLDEKLTSPYELYQFFYNTDDNSVINYLKFFTFLSNEQIANLESSLQTEKKSRIAQKTLAFAIVSLVHGQQAAESAKSSSEGIFSKPIETLNLEELISKIPSIRLKMSEILGGTIETLASISKLTSSKGEAKRLLTQGGLYLNNEKVSESKEIESDDLLQGKYLILRAGKSKQLVIEAVISDTE